MDTVQNPTRIVHLSGWRLKGCIAGLQLAVVLISLESTIVGPSVYPISRDLGDFGLAGWVLTGYLTSFTSFVLVYDQFWHALGAKIVFAFAVFIFTLGALLCAVAQSMQQLIAFRVLQGLGASGVYCIAITIGPILLPRSAVPKYSALTSVVFVTGSVLGIVIGGAISQNASWRWIFWFNVPIGAITEILVLLCVPGRLSLPRKQEGRQLDQGLSREDKPETQNRKSLVTRAIDRLTTLDYAGMSLVVTASSLIVIGAGEIRPGRLWPVALLVVGVVAWILLLVYQWWLSNAQEAKRHSLLRPLIPWKLLTRVSVSVFVSCFFASMPYYGMILTLPLRFQLVGGDSPQASSVKVLPLLLTIPASSIPFMVLVGRKNLPILPTMMVAYATPSLTIGILSALKPAWTAGHYVLETITGLALGPSQITTLIFTQTYALEKSPKYVTVAAAMTLQLRILGGAVSLAIFSNIINSKIISSTGLSEAEKSQLLSAPEAVSHIPPVAQKIAIGIFSQSYRDFWIVTAVTSALSLLIVCCAWEKKWRRYQAQEPAEVPPREDQQGQQQQQQDDVPIVLVSRNSSITRTAAGGDMVEESQSLK